jgi:hypothetical protein
MPAPFGSTHALHPLRPSASTIEAASHQVSAVRGESAVGPSAELEDAGSSGKLSANRVERFAAADGPPRACHGGLVTRTHSAACEQHARRVGQTGEHVDIIHREQISNGGSDASWSPTDSVALPFRMRALPKAVLNGRIRKLADGELELTTDEPLGRVEPD